MKLKAQLPLLVAIVALFCLPLLIQNPYYIHLAETILIYTILLFGLDIVVGYVGQVSLGHAGLFGIGSYTAGVLFFHMGWPIWATIPASIVVTAIFGGILALPALKVVGPYLAMVTLAFGTIAQILINEMTWLTEGPLGIKLTRPELMGVPMDKAEYFWLVAGVMILALIAIDRFVKSQMGRAFEALRDSPVACDCMGVSVYRFKVIAFVIGAGFAGLAGCLYAYSEQYISPNTYNNELAVLFLLGIIMGGRKSRLGVDKDGEEWYQITLGGEQGNDATIGKVIGPSFYADEIPDVITNVINTYVEHRADDESFVDTYRRLGVTPFKEAAYKNAKKKDKAEVKSESAAS